MTKFLFVVNAIGVCDLVCGSQQIPLPRTAIDGPTGESSLQIICDPSPAESANYSLFQNFNNLVTRYFVENFGLGGLKYLKSFQPCVNLQGDGNLTAEMKKIVAVFDRRWWKKEKNIGDVRFRIHRFLGILMLLRQYPSRTFPKFKIDYHKAFPKSGDRKRFDDGLRELKIYTFGEEGERVEDSQFIELVSDCLRLIGTFTMAENGTVSQYSTTANNWSDFVKILKFYRDYCVEPNYSPSGVVPPADFQKAVCYGLLWTARASSDPQTIWEGIASSTPRLFHVKKAEVAKELDAISYLGDGAQVLDCLKLGDKTFSECVLGREYQESNLNALKEKLSTSPLADVCGDYKHPQYKALQIVRVVLCVGCELPSPKEANVIKTSQERAEIIRSCSVLACLKHGNAYKGCLGEYSTDANRFVESDVIPEETSPFLKRIVLIGKCLKEGGFDLSQPAPKGFPGRGTYLQCFDDPLEQKKL